MYFFPKIILFIRKNGVFLLRLREVRFDYLSAQNPPFSSKSTGSIVNCSGEIPKEWYMNLYLDILVNKVFDVGTKLFHIVFLNKKCLTFN